MKTIAALAVLLLSSHLASADVITVDFEILRHDDRQVGLHGNTYAEDGFVIDIVDPPGADGLRTLGGRHRHFSGSTSILNGFGGEFISIHEANGLAFNIISINLDDTGISEEGNLLLDVTFTGFHADGSTVSNTFAIDNRNGQQTFFFTGFENVVDVRVGQFSPGIHQMDNIVLESTAVPEPSSLSVMSIVALVFAVAFSTARFPFC